MRSITQSPAHDRPAVALRLCVRRQDAGAGELTLQGWTLQALTIIAVEDAVVAIAALDTN